MGVAEIRCSRWELRKTGEAVTAQIEVAYRRLPDNTVIYREELVYESPDTLAWMSRIPKINTKAAEIIHRGGKPDPKGYRVIWFVFRNKWFDAGRFLDSMGRFLGYYCDIIEPIRVFTSKRVEVTDLFLDLWVYPDGDTRRLDEDEFEEAVKRDVIKQELAKTALSELAKLEWDVREGRFPPSAMAEVKLPE